MHKATLITLLASMVSKNSFASDVACKELSTDWTWFSDHAALYVTYSIIGEDDRKYEVGTGVSIGGEPRGSRKTFKGSAETTAFLAGTLHIRQKDNGEKFSVCATASDIGLIPLADLLKRHVNIMRELKK